MELLTHEELAFGDQFFTDCNVQDNRAKAGADFNIKLNNEPGIITGFGLEYTKVSTKWGEVFVPWQVTGSVNGIISNIYDFIGIGVPVTVDAVRILDKAYSWLGKNISIHIGKIIDNSPVPEQHFIFNTKIYNSDSSSRKWCSWTDHTKREIGRFIGKGGWNLRKLLEDNNIDNTYIDIQNDVDYDNLITINTMNIHYNKVKNILNNNLY